MTELEQLKKENEELRAENERLRTENASLRKIPQPHQPAQRYIPDEPVYDDYDDRYDR